MVEEYVSPFKKGIEVGIGRPQGEARHENYPQTAKAVDFKAKEGTEVCAIKGGEVIVVEDGFGGTKGEEGKTWGLNRKFVDKTNYVAIKHKDGTISEYLHLGKGTAKVKKGDIVNAGDVIGELGYSGCMPDIPHLHLNVVKVVEGKAISTMPSGLLELLKKFPGYEKIKSQME